MKKRKDRAFGKDVYLLGKDLDGTLLWLESGSWDCDWYWGFGYVESYTNNLYPGRAKDITCHQHFDGLVGLKLESGDYVHHLNESPEIKETTLSDSESWKLSDLMMSFYTLRKTAELYHQGNSHLTSTQGCDLKNKEAEERINSIEIPKIMNAVYELLAPNEEEK